MYDWPEEGRLAEYLARIEISDYKLDDPMEGVPGWVTEGEHDGQQMEVEHD